MRLGKTLRFMQGLWALSHALDAKSKRMQRELGLTGPQRLVLRIVGHHPGIAPRDLATSLHLHPSTLTGVLARLEGQGLIERRIDPSDRRRARIALTRRGQTLDEDLEGTVEAAVRRALERCEPNAAESSSILIDAIVEELRASSPPRGRRGR